MGVGFAEVLVGGALALAAGRLLDRLPDGALVERADRLYAQVSSSRSSGTTDRGSSTS